MFEELNFFEKSVTPDNTFNEIAYSNIWFPLIIINSLLALISVDYSTKANESLLIPCVYGSFTYVTLN